MRTRRTPECVGEAQDNVLERASGRIAKEGRIGGGLKRPDKGLRHQVPLGQSQGEEEEEDEDKPRMRPC